MKRIGNMLVEEFEDKIPPELHDQMRQSLTYRRYKRESKILAKMLLRHLNGETVKNSITRE